MNDQNRTAHAADRVNVATFRTRYRDETGFDGPLPEVAFGADSATAEQLARLVAIGVKTATTSVLAAYRIEDAPLPAVGGRAVVVDSSGSPVAVITTTAVTVRRYGDIDAAHAYREGEGDRTLEAWRTAHEAFFDDVCATLKLPFDDDLELVCEQFQVIWPPAASRRASDR